MGRRVYSVQFKQEAVAMTRQPDATIAGVARNLGIGEQTLRYWIDHPPTEKRHDRACQEESNDPAALKLQLKEAQARIRRLEMERDILKKATAYFASQNP
ncbi:MAG TPA: transposase [Lacunisphaera sp.]|jgi:transposase|nr:transposase [Lacunisphaera sp.]